MLGRLTGAGGGAAASEPLEGTAMRLVGVVLLAGMASLATPVHSAEEASLPPGWFRAGTHSADYEMGIDPSGGSSGKPCAFIRGRGATPAGFGTLMQMFKAVDYAGKRVRLSASVKAEQISAWAGLWMRVDGAPAQGTKMLAFDNMQGRPIKGTHDWRRYEIVLDVPPEAAAIGFGILLSGPGRAWMDGLQLETVGTDVPRTDTILLPDRPNLRFEK
jgi:hypothetical protein